MLEVFFRRLLPVEVEIWLAEVVDVLGELVFDGVGCSKGVYGYCMVSMLSLPWKGEVLKSGGILISTPKSSGLKRNWLGLAMCWCRI